jgi:hypothetical protein
MLRRLCIAALGLAIIGCRKPSADAPSVQLLPVSGIISVNGEPAAGVRVTLHPVDANGLGVVTPSGVGDENGAFILTTYAPGDGAPVGKYRVTASWADILNTGSDPEYGKEKLPARYQSPDQSGLECEIRQENMDLLVFDLKTK